jgi:putative nucleotidyltransferase with HDIG domain
MVYLAISLAVLLIIVAIAVIVYKRKIKFFCEVQKQLLSRYTALEAQLIKTSASVTPSNLDDKVWHEEETNFVFKLHEQMSLTLERLTAAKQIVEDVHNFLNAQETILLLLDKNTKELKVAYAIADDKNAIENIILKDGESISEFVISQNKPLMVDNLDRDYYFKKINKKESYLKGNFISIPIIFQEEALGVLHVCGKKNNTVFTKKDFSFLINVGKVGAIALKNILLYEQINENYLKTIAALAQAIDARDPYTKFHSENVTKYSMAMAKEMNFNHQEQEILKRAALLHDVGKIGIRDNVLLKESKLTPEEFEIMKTHPVKGEEILKSLSFLRDVSTLMRHHHERYDGTGYPDKIKGHEIELGARIMAVADTFDAMTTDRPYRKALSLNDAIVELERFKNMQFDPDVVDCFVKILKENPDIMRSQSPGK